MEHARAGSAAGGGRQVEVLKTTLKTQRSEAQQREEALQVLRMQPLFAVCEHVRGHENRHELSAPCAVCPCSSNVVTMFPTLAGVRSPPNSACSLMALATSSLWQSQLRGLWDWADKERKTLVRQVRAGIHVVDSSTLAGGGTLPASCGSTCWCTEQFARECRGASHHKNLGQNGRGARARHVE